MAHKNAEDEGIVEEIWGVWDAVALLSRVEILGVDQVEAINKDVHDDT